jgi:hypothetical protein
MYQGNRKYKHLGLAFKEHIVLERLKGEVGVKRLATLYCVSPKEIRLWTKRYLAGEALKMKMGRPRKHPVEGQADPEAVCARGQWDSRYSKMGVQRSCPCPSRKWPTRR